MSLIENLVSKAVQVTGLSPVTVHQGLVLLAYVTVAYAMFRYQNRLSSLPEFLKRLSRRDPENKVEPIEQPVTSPPMKGYDVLANEIKRLNVQIEKLSLKATRMENLEKNFGVTGRLRINGKGLWDPETGNLYDFETFELLATGHQWSRPEVGEESLPEVQQDEIQPPVEIPISELTDLNEEEVPIEVAPLEEFEEEQAPPEAGRPPSDRKHSNDSL